MDNVTIFINRMKKLGIEVELTANLPWIYISKINGKLIKELYEANHGWTIAFYNKKIQFTNIGEIFKLIRKYK